MSRVGHIRRDLAAILVLVTIGTSACSDESAVSVQTITSSVSAILAPGQSFHRDTNEGGEWLAMSDAELWTHVSRGGGLVTVGVRAPGRKRGVERGILRLDDVEWARLRRQVSSLPGVEERSTISQLAAIQLKVRDADALSAIRRLPIVDYVEPVYISTQDGLSSHRMDLGCGYENWTGAYPNRAGYSPTGDLVSVYWGTYYMAITNAWRRSTGAGITIGITDTGIDPLQTQMTTDFDNGGSRWHRYMNWDGETSTIYWQDECGHGTRLAGVATAPRDGKNIAGVAHGANLVAVNHEDDIVAGPPSDLNANQAAAALLRAYYEGSKVISIAWGSLTSSAVLSDAIELMWLLGDVLFVGAAGTSACWNPFKSVVFPARHVLVMAVTGVDPNGWVTCDSHRGPEVELVAHVYQPAPGPIRLGAAPINNTSGSSNATGTITGIAALVWAQDPNLSGAQVRSLLHRAGSQFPNWSPTTGVGVINAHRALGGMWKTNLNGCQKEFCDFLYKLGQCTTKYFYLSYTGGDGPYTYSWSTGSTASWTSLLLCLTAGAIANYTVSGSVTDNFDGTVIAKYIDIEVISTNPDDACRTCAL